MIKGGKMKTENQITAQIRKMGKWKHRYDDKGFSRNAIERFQENIDSQIRVLRWVLGEKVTSYYFCVGCLIAHEGKECPICGGHTVK